MKRRIFKVAVSVEHVRGWGRRICEGIAAYSRERPDWSIRLFEDGLPSREELDRCDGFLWCVFDAATAAALAANGRPVVDLVSDGMFPGTIAVGADQVACGQLAARHFITHRLRNFAFLGWKGQRFSDIRQATYSRTLALNRFSCAVYLSRAVAQNRFADRNVYRERLTLPSDARAIERWVRRLPKPVGVFCANDLRAWQLSEICRRAGIAVPNEVAILGADNDPVPCFFVSTPLSSVDTDTFATGYRAAEVLGDILDGKRRKDCARVAVKPLGVVSRASTAVYPVDPPWLATALEYIRSNVAKGLTAAEVAKVAGRSYVVVEKAFKRKLGTTIQKEIVSSRLETAQHLLAATHRPLGEIAKLSGFRSVQYLCLCFKKQFGASPLAYRQSAAR